MDMAAPGRRARARALALTSIVMLSVGALGVPARADTQAVVVAARTQFVPGDLRNHVPVVIPQGGSILFQHLDPLATFSGGHTLTSNATDGSGAPIFDTGEIHFPASTTLDLSTLPAGAYKFHCNVHLEMVGLLCVESPDHPTVCTT